MFKRKITILLILLLSILLYNCLDDNDNETINKPPEIIQVELNSFSKSYAYIGEEVSILGKNFVTNKSDVKVFLDDKEVNISLLTDKSITFSIPKGVSQLPKLRVEILNSYIDYYGMTNSLVILHNTKGKWIEVLNNLHMGKGVRELKGISKEEIYFSKNTGKSFFKSIKLIDGGVKYGLLPNYQYDLDFGGGFHIGKSGIEYSMVRASIYYRNSSKYKEILYNFSTRDVIPEHYPNDSNSVIRNFWPLSFFVDKEENKIIFATSTGEIFKAQNGVIENIYKDENVFKFKYKCFYANSVDEMWLGGFLYDKSLNYTPAKLLYLKEGQWYKKILTFQGKKNNSGRITEIKFIDKFTGHAIVQSSNQKGSKYLIIKFSEGGDNYKVIREQDSSIAGFSFKDINTGWFVSENKVYKTNDGGHTWKLDYTNESNCLGVLYNQGIVWVIADKKVLKYYL